MPNEILINLVTTNRLHKNVYHFLQYTGLTTSALDITLDRSIATSHWIGRALMIYNRAIVMDAALSNNKTDPTFIQTFVQKEKVRVWYLLVGILAGRWHQPILQCAFFHHRIVKCSSWRFCRVHPSGVRLGLLWLSEDSKISQTVLLKLRGREYIHTVPHCFEIYCTDQNAENAESRGKRGTNLMIHRQKIQAYICSKCERQLVKKSLTVTYNGWHNYAHM